MNSIPTWKVISLWLVLIVNFCRQAAKGSLPRSLVRDWYSRHPLRLDWQTGLHSVSLVHNKITTLILFETFNLRFNMLTTIPRFFFDHSICDVHLSSRKKPSEDEHFIQIFTKSLTKIITTNLHTSPCNIPLLVLRYRRRNFP